MRSCTRLTVVLALLTAAACDTRAPVAPTAPAARTNRIAAEREGGHDDARLVFAPSAHPYGHSMVGWSEDSWRWVLAQPESVNPLLDATGADCAVGQKGHVWYLAPYAGGAAARTCTVPAHRALFILLSGVLNDYPCPDTSFHPAPGQSLQDFLTQGARGPVDIVDSLVLTIDGQPVHGLFAYRFTSPLYHFTGSSTLTTSVDPCITGHSQPAVSDGYYVMVKPLSPGSHTIVDGGFDTQGHGSTDVWTLTVQRDRDRGRDHDAR